MPNHETLNYVEFPSKNLAATKAFFTAAFKWSFVDYGPDYTAFSNQGLDGGFFRSEVAAVASNGSALLVFFSDTLEQTLEKVEDSGAEIAQAIYAFPGGRRFHFIEPGGNEFAVWGQAGA